MALKIAIVGVGNCASALIQCIEADKNDRLNVGLTHFKIGNYRVSDIEVVCAFDVNAWKIGRDLSEAIYESPNCTTNRFAVTTKGVKVECGRILDGVCEEMHEKVNVSPASQDISTQQIISSLKKTNTELVVSYLPVGSQKASEFYAEAAAEAGAGFINCTPAEIACSEKYQSLFSSKGLVLLGDDIKSQFGSTAIHRALIDLLQKKGLSIEYTYQVNLGGNTDFQNMDTGSRGIQKKHTKENSLRTLVHDNVEVSVAPSEFIPSLKDYKTGIFSIRGRGILDMPFSMDLRIELEDSPNSAGVVVNAIRTAKVAAERGRRGVIDDVCPYFFKNPPKSASEPDSLTCLDSFLRRS